MMPFYVIDRHIHPPLALAHNLTHALSFSYAFYSYSSPEPLFTHKRCLKAEVTLSHQRCLQSHFYYSDSNDYGYDHDDFSTFSPSLTISLAAYSPPLCSTYESSI